MDIPYDEAKFIELLLHVADRLRHDRAGGVSKPGKSCSSPTLPTFARIAGRSRAPST